MGEISNFIVYQRKKLKLTQNELAEKSGVGIRFVRELEKGKETVQLDKVNQVLALFGFSAIPGRQQVDPYDVRLNFFKLAVKVTLTDRTVKYGIITKEIIDSENKITAWLFVNNRAIINYLKSRKRANSRAVHNTSDLTETIEHSKIQKIELQ